MRLDLKVLRSSVGRRIFLLFVVCALVPIGILTLISYRSVSLELEEQSTIRLRRLAKSQVMSIVQRLELLSVELEVVRQQLRATGTGDVAGPIGRGHDRSADRFVAISLESADSEASGHRAAATDPAAAGTASPVRLNADDSTLSVEASGDGSARLFLSRPVDAAEPQRGRLLAEINPAFLWWGPPLENTLPPASELCVLDAERATRLFCPERSESLRELLREAPVALGEVQWSRDDEAFLASYRTANLEAQFGFPGLTVVLSQERSYLLSPLADFRRSFPPIVVASLGAVLLLSISQIRKRMVPLERLQSGTRRVAERDFTARVEIDSGDEFEQLAEDFNSMADRLGRQFGALRSMNDIVQAVLSELDRVEIVRSVLRNFGDLMRSDALRVMLFEGSATTTARVYSLDGENGIRSEVIQTRHDELERLRREPRLVMLDSSSGPPARLGWPDPREIASVAVFPISVDGQLAGTISAGFGPGAAPEPEDLQRARQLADQVAVAFSNSRLLRQVEELSEGALTALARSIDAKSHWTAGHSERVARMAVSVGQAMGLPDEDLDVLRRGSLLHDLGKIGVSSSILDKPGRLTEAEMEIVQGHVRIGARILEPIAQLEDLLPLVLQHHEWFNGGGYPEGLAGEQISLLARAMAVADIYDALRSPRPYRSALEHDAVIQRITAWAGTQLDPQVVSAFVKSEAWRSRELGEAEPV